VPPKEGRVSNLHGTPLQQITAIKPLASSAVAHIVIHGELIHLAHGSHSGCKQDTMYPPKPLCNKTSATVYNHGDEPEPACEGVGAE
jgi:hypothetical protein